MSHKWHSVLFTSVIIACIEGFNLDVNHTIVYEYPNKEVRRSSYFGFSLLLYSGSSGDTPWIQIGAPRGNDQTLYWGVEEPGLVFRCPIRSPCSNVVLENGGSGFVRDILVRGQHVKYTDKKETAWIGGAMDIDEKTGRVVVCGHRWRDDHTKREVFEYMTGVCYLSTLQQSTNGYRNADKLLPFVDPVHYFTPRGANLHYLLNYGMAQAGSSVHFPKSKEQEILIGAPGAANWKGRTALYQNNHGYSLTPEVFNVRELEIADYSLFGYQVNSGKFKKHDSVYYVTGNPKGAKHMGIVYIYSYDVQNGKYNVKKITSVEGTKPGEYFGSSLAVADINCDHVDDLIVGAPLYSIENDEGRIYTFMANFKSTVFNSPTAITGEHADGRFGTTVTSLGDLDNDGCEDIAVGAPYENNHSGAVYIYSGSEQGLILTQKISGSDIVVNPPLKGFGLGISRAADIDYNKYPDVAVGAFLSEHVVLFRALPVVTLNTHVNSRVKKLKKDAKSFTITVCLSYSGISVPQVLTVSRKIILDEMYLRAHFKNKESTMISNITISSKQHCNDIEVFLLKTAIEDNTSGPIIIKVSQELVNSARTKTVFIVGTKTSAEAQDGFQNNIAVVNERHSTKSAVLSVEFDPECGENNVCEAILNLNCTLLGITNEGYILGSNAKLQLEINLTNSGGPAYSTNVDISIPSPIELSLGHENCVESLTSSGTLLHCNLGHPLRNGTLKNLTLNLNTRGVKPGSKNLTFNISATTSSKDKNANINTKQLQLNFIIDADVIITGRSDELVYDYNKDNKTVFRHKYEVFKNGSSPIDVVEIELNIPFKWKEKDGNITFLNIYSPMGYLNAEQPLVCSPVQDFEYYIEENLVKEEDINIVQRSKREVNSAVPQPADNQTLFLNCSSSAVECVKIKCSAGPFESGSQTSASVELKLILNVTNLVPVMGKKDVIYFSTDGAVSIKEPEILNITKRFHYKIVSTKFENTTYAESVTKKVATWIVALAIIAGILIFMFVVIGLMKAGFFERKKKEELKSLMAIYATNVFMAGPIQNSYQTVENGDADDNDDCHEQKTQEPEE